MDGREDDGELIAAAVRGDDAAFERFYDRHVQAVFAHALSDLGNRQEAQDVTQEVFEIAWTKRRRIRLADNSARAWLLATSRGQLANRRRKQDRRPEFFELGHVDRTMGATDSFEPVEAQAFIAEIEHEVATMPPLDRDVYRAIVREEKSFLEASADLGISLASVKKRLHRVRTRLRTRFGGEL